MTRQLLVRKDTLDERDSHFVRGIFPPAATSEASLVDLSQWLPDVRDQGMEGACTMFAGSGILAWHYNRFKSESRVFSPQFGYRAERIIEHTTAEDAGAQSRTMMKVLTTYGLPLESSFPYDDREWKKETPFELLAEARQFRLGAYHRVTSLQSLLSVLRSGYVASLAIEIYDSFQTDHVMATGVVPMPKPHEKLQGAHEVYTYGFDEAKQVLLCRNSWGTKWGMKGNFTLPFDFFNPHVMDSWTCHFGKPWK